jgi:hypothetical protein
MKCFKCLKQQLELLCSIGRSREIQKSNAIEKDSAEMDTLGPLLFDAIVMFANETPPRGGLQRKVLNQFYSQCLESHHQTVENFHPNQSG